MHGWYLRFEGDKGLQFAKWCELPFLLGVLAKEEVYEAVDAYEETRSSSHVAALAEWEAEVAAQEEGLAIRAAQARQAGGGGSAGGGGGERAGSSRGVSGPVHYRYYHMVLLVLPVNNRAWYVHVTGREWTRARAVKRPGITGKGTR